MIFRRKYNYRIYDADGNVIASGFRCHLNGIHITFEDMRPTAKMCIITRGKHKMMCYHK